MVLVAYGEEGPRTTKPLIPLNVSIDGLRHTCIASGRCTIGADLHDAPRAKRADVWAEVRRYPELII
jgi:hypothetical protein